MQEAAGTHVPVALLMLDIDDFKHVNDVHGHAVGDELLRFLAEALRAIVRPEDVILTRNMKLAGRITNPALKATTSQFGDVTLRLADMRSLRSQALADPEAVLRDLATCSSSGDNRSGDHGSGWA